MERLTKPDINVKPRTDQYLRDAVIWEECNDKIVDLLLNGPSANAFNKNTFRRMARDLYGRLKAYEDTGLAPDGVAAQELWSETVCEALDPYKTGTIDLYRLRELAEADKEGRLVILPAKTVYELAGDAGPSCDMKCPSAFTDDDGCPCCDFCDKGEILVHERDCRQDDVRQIGNTVWLTREEAEAALKEVRNGNR